MNAVITKHHIALRQEGGYGIFYNLGCQAKERQTRNSTALSGDGDLKISLSSPSGTTIDLFEGEGEPTDNLIMTFTPDTLIALEDFNGETASGVWSLRIIGRVGLDEGTLVKWGLKIHLS